MTNFEPADHWRARRIALQAFLRDHYGVIATKELHALGFKPPCITRLLEDGILVRITFGVYRGAGSPESHEGMLRWALLKCGPTSALTRLSAGHFLGHLQWPPSKPQILIPGPSGYRKHPKLERHGATTVKPGDIIVVRGLRTTSPRRLILDLAADAARESKPQNIDKAKRALRRVLRGAAHEDDALVGTLRQALEAAPFPGSRVLNAELTGGLARTRVVRSNVEDRFVELCKRFGIPLPQTNALVHGWELDAYWELYGAYVEIDVYETHRDEITFERDRQKASAMSGHELRGFAITDRRIDHFPAEVAADVRHLLRLD